MTSAWVECASLPLHLALGHGTPVAQRSVVKVTVMSFGFERPHVVPLTPLFSATEEGRTHPSGPVIRGGGQETYEAGSTLQI